MEHLPRQRGERRFHIDRNLMGGEREEERSSHSIHENKASTTPKQSKTNLANYFLPYFFHAYARTARKRAYLAVSLQEKNQVLERPGVTLTFDQSTLRHIQ